MKTPIKFLRATTRFPLVSVIMGVYNRKAFLREAIESILNQSEPNFELIIVNDGSTKEIRDYLCSFEDPRIVTVHRRYNGGIARARNEGLQRARGEWITFFDSDDIMPRDSLKLRLDALKEKPSYRAAFGKMTTLSKGFDCPKYRLRYHTWPEICYQYAHRLGEIPAGVARFCHCIPWPLTSQIFHSPIIRSVGKLDKAFVVSDDTEFAYRVNDIAPSLFVDAPVLYYRLHGNNFSATREDLIGQEFFILDKMRKKLLESRILSHA